MIKINITAVAAAIALAFSAGAMATSMSKNEYNATRASIATDYKSATAGCDSFSANAKDVCMAVAKGKENVAKAELEAAFKPTKKTNYNVSVARAQADYLVAKEQCDDKAGNAKDVCVKEAKAAQIIANADAKALLKTTDANQVARDKTTVASTNASEKRAAARQEAATDKRNAEYTVAKEKCEVFAGDTKDACVKDAKVRYGQS